jgi:hypothetical protein
MGAITMTYGPPELSQVGLDPGNFKKVTDCEYHGPCLWCHGTDRFVVWTEREFPSWRWMCRQCSPEGGWFDEINPRLKQELSPDEIARFARERAIRERQLLDQSIKRAQEASKELRETEKWLEYYENAGKRGRKLWELRGIPETFQHFWELGFCEDYTLWRKDGDSWIDWWHSPTLSIPIRGFDWQVNNIKHRLLQEPDDAGKYRYEKSGLPAASFVCIPDRISGPLFLAEGEIKAMVTMATLDNDSLQVIGIPSVSPDVNLFALLDEFEPIYLCLDPDAFEKQGPKHIPAAEKVISALGKNRVRVIELPDKIDDLIVAGVLDKPRLQKIIKRARRA